MDDIIWITAESSAKEGKFVQPIGGDFPVKGKAYRDLAEEEWCEVRSVSQERHFALNWLCSSAPGDDCDQTPTNT